MAPAPKRRSVEPACVERAEDAVMPRVLVTGASGLVGRALLERLAESGGHELRAAVRSDIGSPVAGAEYCRVAGLEPGADWSGALARCDTVVHAAARVHVMREAAADPLAEFRRVNVAGTEALARQAVAAGVRRFVFVSSVKVNGEQTLPGRPFLPSDPARPVDPYGISKLEAETAIRSILEPAGVEWVIVRPTLVYGPGVRANFLAMMQWLERRIPLPLAAIRNRRSLTALDNLTSLLERCASHPAAARQVFFSGDGEDLSTPDLLRRIGRAMGRPARLIPVPPQALVATASLLGRGDFARRLVGSLQVDIGKARELLGWAPVVSVDAALQKTVDAFLQGRRG
jgi:nucleoside-diphosphate-sugar epimerase